MELRHIHYFLVLAEELDAGRAVQQGAAQRAEGHHHLLRRPAGLSRRQRPGPGAGRHPYVQLLRPPPDGDGGGVQAAEHGQMGAAHGEGGDDHVAALGDGLVDDLSQLIGVAPDLGW